MRKNEKGITLIALVITIIVLIILAAVSIAMLTGNSGIILNAKNAKTANIDGQAREAEGMLLSQWNIYKNTTEEQSLEDFLEKNGGNKTTKTITVNGIEFVVSENAGNIIISKKDSSENEELEPTPAEFFIFDEETGTITGIVKNETMDPNGIGWYVDENYNVVISHTDIVIPRIINGVEVKGIGYGAFVDRVTMGYRPFPIKSMIIPDTITRIGAYAFQGIKLESIVIPDSVTEIDYAAFAGASLKNIRLGTGLKKIPDCFARYCDELVSVEILGDIEEIGSEAFNYCSELSSITIPDSVTSIGQAAFARCAVTNITIPNSVTSMGNGVFYDANHLTDIYCEASSKPSGWDESWNSGCSATVHWGVNN